MEFWGVEVKPGVPRKVKIIDDRAIHVSQAALGETKKGNENVVLFVNFKGTKLVLGTLSLDKCPQINYDLIFEKEFELSHNWKNGSVYFSGYRSILGSDFPSDDSDDSDSDDEIPLVANGKPEPLEDSKVGSSAAKPKVKIVEPKKDDESEDDDSDDSSDEGESDEEEENTGVSDGTNGNDDSEDDEDEDTPDKGKKRSAETSASKTPVDKKKAKLSTLQKSGADGKKGNVGHVATPHPGKKAGKSDKSKQETPKSAASQVSCNTCSKTFNSEKGLESHTKAKH